jgi:hypothetical protein
MNRRKVIGAFILVFFLITLVGPLWLGNAGNETNRPTINQARRVVTCFEDGTFWFDHLGAVVASNAKNTYTGYLFENFNISGDSRIDNATLTLYYYNNLDYGTNDTFILIEGILGSPLSLGWDDVVNGYDTASFVTYNVSTWIAEGYYTINVTEIIQEMVLLPTYQAGDNFLLRTFHLAPSGPGADPTYYDYSVKSNIEPEASKRPSLQIGWTPGVFYDGWDITPLPSGFNATPIGYYSTGNGNEHILMFNGTSGEIIANNTQKAGEFVDFRSTFPLMLNGSAYFINSTGYLKNTTDAGLTWEVVAQIDSNLLANPFQHPYGLTYDYENNMIHVGYHYQTFDVYYVNVSLTTGTAGARQLVNDGGSTYSGFRSLYIDFFEGNGSIFMLRAGDTNTGTNERLDS